MEIDIMRHYLSKANLSKVMGYAINLGVKFKESKINKDYVELSSWPEDMKAQDVKEYFKSLNAPFELI